MAARTRAQMMERMMELWLAHVRVAAQSWLSQATTGTYEQGRQVLHTAFIPGSDAPHYLRARQALRQIEALAAEWGRRRHVALSLQLFRMADQLTRVVRQHEVEMLIRRYP